jgi:hypothetical protein
MYLCLLFIHLYVTVVRVNKERLPFEDVTLNFTTLSPVADVSSIEAVFTDLSL